MHNLCVFCTFSTFAQKIFKGWGWNFTRSFGKVMRSKSMKMVFVARMIRHKLCMIYAFFYFLCSKIIFDEKLISYCWDKFDYPWSIVYLSCSSWWHITWKKFLNSFISKPRNRSYPRNSRRDILNCRNGPCTIFCLWLPRVWDNTNIPFWSSWLMQISWITTFVQKRG